jgi:uncharacterized OB-fold protein
MTIPHPEAEWRAHLAAGRFMLQRNAATCTYVFYPRIAEPGTGASHLEWVEAFGMGIVHAVTIVRRKAPEPDYNVVLVDLPEGVRLMSRVVECQPEEIRIGDAVRARIDDVEGQPTLVFLRT